MAEKMKMFDDQLMYSITDLMEILNMTRPTINKMMEEKKIGHYRKGARIFVSEAQLKAYGESTKVDPA